MDLFTIRGKCR